MLSCGSEWGGGGGACSSRERQREEKEHWMLCACGRYTGMDSSKLVSTRSLRRCNRTNCTALYKARLRELTQPPHPARTSRKAQDTDGTFSNVCARTHTKHAVGCNGGRLLMGEGREREHLNEESARSLLPAKTRKITTCADGWPASAGGEGTLQRHAASALSRSHAHTHPSAAGFIKSAKQQTRHAERHTHTHTHTPSLDQKTRCQGVMGTRANR